jgi:hypothetical protein
MNTETDDLVLSVACDRARGRVAQPRSPLRDSCSRVRDTAAPGARLHLFATPVVVRSTTGVCEFLLVHSLSRS